MVNLPARFTETESRNFLQARISINNGLAIVSIVSAALGALAIVFLQLIFAGVGAITRKMRASWDSSNLLTRHSPQVLFAQILDHETTAPFGLSHGTAQYKVTIEEWRTALTKAIPGYISAQNNRNLSRALELLIELKICDLKLTGVPKTFDDLILIVMSSGKSTFQKTHVPPLVAVLMNNSQTTDSVVGRIDRLCNDYWDGLPAPADKPEAARSSD